MEIDYGQCLLRDDIISQVKAWTLSQTGHYYDKDMGFPPLWVTSQNEKIKANCVSVGELIRR